MEASLGEVWFITFAGVCVQVQGRRGCKRLWLWRNPSRRGFLSHKNNKKSPRRGGREEGKLPSRGVHGLMRCGNCGIPSRDRLRFRRVAFVEVAKETSGEKGADSCCGCLQPFQAKLCSGKGGESFNITRCSAFNSVRKKPRRGILAQGLKSHGRPWACLACPWRGDIARSCRDLAFCH